MSRDALDERLRLPRSYGHLLIGIRRGADGRPYVAIEGGPANFKADELDRVGEAWKRCRELILGTTKDEPKNVEEMKVLRGGQ